MADPKSGSESDIDHVAPLVGLPDDLFVLILQYLETWEVVRCQNVSRSWRSAFTRADFLEEMLRRQPRVRRPQLSRWTAERDDATELKCQFATIAARQYNLVHGKVGVVQRHKLRALDQIGKWYPVEQWDYHESQPGGRLYYADTVTHLDRLGNKPYLFRPTLWSYDDGLLACARVPIGSEVHSPCGVEGEFPLFVLDLTTSQPLQVPFSITNKVIRNIKLRNRVLVVEWAEQQPFHDLNEAEKVHRHFATCYSINGCDERPGTLTAHFRNEWKMHFLGLPLASRDRFFSTHDGTCYAIYYWQPNRSMYTGDEDMPIEKLFVWDISTPSDYRPSRDPTGRSMPPGDQGAHTVSRLTFRELDFLGIRQHANVGLMSLAVDSEHSNLSFVENVSIAGQGYFDPAVRQTLCTTVTTFPFQGDGPAHRRAWALDLPPYRGHCSMESAPLSDAETWYVPIMDVHDPLTDVRFSLVETSFTGMSAQNGPMVRITCLGRRADLEQPLVDEVAGMGRIAGDERWLVGQNRDMELVVLTF